MKIANFDFHCDLNTVILWQYLDAEKLKSLVRNQQTFMNDNVEGFFDDFNKDVLNIETANAFGLGVWGALLQVPRPTYNDGGVQVEFTDDQYRLLLRAKIYLLTFDGSARALNEFFHILFPNLIVEIIDNGNMTANINFLNGVPAEYEILFQSPYSDIFLPRPSGVEYIMNATPVDYTKVFGFEGMVDSNNNSVAGFDNGTFYQG